MPLSQIPTYVKLTTKEYLNAFTMQEYEFTENCTTYE